MLQQRLLLDPMEKRIFTLALFFLLYRKLTRNEANPRQRAISVGFVIA